MSKERGEEITGSENLEDSDPEGSAALRKMAEAVGEGTQQQGGEERENFLRKRIDELVARSKELGVERRHGSDKLRAVEERIMEMMGDSNRAKPEYKELNDMYQELKGLFDEAEGIALKEYDDRKKAGKLFTPR